MATEQTLMVMLAIILGTLAAIVYALRILVLLERRVARMDHHVELMTMSILRDEKRLLAEEDRIKELVAKYPTKSAARAAPKKVVKKAPKKKKK